MWSWSSALEGQLSPREHRCRHIRFPQQRDWRCNHVTLMSLLVAMNDTVLLIPSSLQSRNHQIIMIVFLHVLLKRLVEIQLERDNFIRFIASWTKDTERYACCMIIKEKQQNGDYRVTGAKWGMDGTSQGGRIDGGWNSSGCEWCQANPLWRTTFFWRLYWREVRLINLATLQPTYWSSYCYFTNDNIRHSDLLLGCY